MRRICTGCGMEIPEGNDFCYECGAWADKALVIDDEGQYIYSKFCIKCGSPLSPDSEYCKECGAKTEESNIPISAFRTPRRYTNRDILALILAIVPGFLNIYGLGQIVQKRWSKAFTYICITAILLYIQPAFFASNNLLVLLFLQLGIFVISLLDIFKGINQGDS